MARCIVATFLLLTMLQAISFTTAAPPGKIQCSNGEYVESENLCNTTTSTTDQFANCSGSYCTNNGSDHIDNKGTYI